MLFGILGRKENFLPKQLPFCPFILFFNLLKNRQKSNFTLYCGEKKFPLPFPSNIGRIKNCGTHQCFFLPLFPSLLFSSSPNNPLLHFPSQNPLKLFLPSNFHLYQTQHKYFRSHILLSFFMHLLSSLFLLFWYYFVFFSISFSL